MPAFRLVEAFTEFTTRGTSRVIGDARGITSAFTKVAGVAGIASAAIAAVGAAGVLTFLRMGAAIENVRKQFEILTGDAEESRRIVERIGEFTARSPFDRIEVADAAKQLLQFNVAAEDVFDTLTIIGNAAAISSRDLDQIASIFGKIRSNGRAMNDELDRLGEAGIPIRAQLAEDIGIAEAEIRELASSGEIGFERFMRSMRRLTSEGGRFGNAMDEMSETTEGALQEVRDSFQATVNRIATGVRDEIDVSGVASDLAILIRSFDDLDQRVEAVGETTRSFFGSLGQDRGILPFDLDPTFGAFEAFSAQVREQIAEQRAFEEFIAKAREEANRGRAEEREREAEAAARQAESEARIAERRKQQAEDTEATFGRFNEQRLQLQADLRDLQTGRTAGERRISDFAARNDVTQQQVDELRDLNQAIEAGNAVRDAILDAQQDAAVADRRVASAQEAIANAERRQQSSTMGFEQLSRSIQTSVLSRDDRLEQRLEASLEEQRRTRQAVEAFQQQAEGQGIHVQAPAG